MSQIYDALILLFVFLIWLRGTRVSKHIEHEYDRWLYKRRKRNR